MEKKKELTALLEADPYKKGSFAMMGYKLKDGSQVGGDESTIYLYISGDDEKVEAAGERLKELLVEVPADLEEKIIGIITEEEDKAASGMGDIFG